MPENGNPPGGGPEFPADITFKVICRNAPHLESVFRELLAGHGLDAVITSRASSGGVFISYTVTARYSSEEELNLVCSKIRSVKGVMSMF